MRGVLFAAAAGALISLALIVVWIGSNGPTAADAQTAAPAQISDAPTP